ncbi:RHO4 protein, partial [Friedmanniomyces endolithicus]
GKAVAQKMGALYMECSSKEMSGVHDIFETAIDIAVRGQDDSAEAEAAMRNGGGGRSGGGGGGVMPAKRKKRSNCKLL